MSEFTPEERRQLEPFVTSLDSSVFGLQNLPEVIKGALFSRYSRSPKSVRRLLLDEFMGDGTAAFEELTGAKKGDLSQAVTKAQAFYDRILDGYGDDSVGELGGAHVACENVSNLAAKWLEDPRLGGSPLEKSSRYVWFLDKKDGDYLFYKEPTLMRSQFAQRYLDINRKLFMTYEKLAEPMMEWVRERFPVETFPYFNPKTKETIVLGEIEDELVRKRATIAHRSAVKAHSCDILRGLLPTSTLTNVGIFGNGRFFQGLLTRLYSSDLEEMNTISKEMHEALNHLIPSFVRRGAVNEYTVQTRESTEQAAKLVEGPVEQAPMVELVDYDKDVTLLYAKMLYASTGQPLTQLRTKVNGMSSEERKKLMQSYVGERRTRRDRPGRAFEDIYYTFDVLADFGNYRDLQRHRILTQERQLLSTRNGYTMPEEIKQAGFENEYVECMKAAHETYEAIVQEFPKQAQYVVPFAYNIRWYVKMNLREAMHLIELRSTPQGHAGYRKIVQLMFEEIKKVHPGLAEHMNFVDMGDYSLGRLGAEMQKEEKRAARTP